MDSAARVGDCAASSQEDGSIERPIKKQCESREETLAKHQATLATLKTIELTNLSISARARIQKHIISLEAKLEAAA